MNIITKAREKIYTQQYGQKQQIEGVEIIPLKHFVSEDGDFGELVRITTDGTIEQKPGFAVRQMSRSMVMPGAVKGWHIHYSQDELWYVPPQDNLLIGLWDCRQESSTSDMTMRIPMGGGVSQMVYIPRGVAHGCTNLSSRKATLIYFMNNTFNSTSPDEQRIPFDTIPGFWLPQRD